MTRYERALLREPRNGEQQLYINRAEWRWYQKFLPEDLRLSGDRLPAEEWWQCGEHTIHLDRYEQAGARAKLILVHGGGGNGRVLSAFALMARKAGMAVVAPDLPGYGLTVRRRGVRPTYRLWAEVLERLIEAEHERDGLPVFLWGLSLGGLAAYMGAALNPSARGVVATTLADTTRPGTMAQVAKWRWLGAVSFVGLKLVGPLLDWIRLPIRWISQMNLISNDPDISAVFSRDRLAGGSVVRIGFLRSLMNVRPAKAPEEFRCPLLLAHPGLDPWTPTELSLPFYNRIAGPKRMLELTGCGHFPVEEPGRMELEAALDRFVTDVLDGSL